MRIAISLPPCVFLPMILYGYALSSAAYRVRIALALKGLQVTSAPVNLRAGEQRLEEFLQINSQGFVPALALDDGTVLTQSVAIIEYLDEIHPNPPLLPQTPLARARVRAIAQAIACDVHPLNNLRVLQYLEHELRHDMAMHRPWRMSVWCRRWPMRGASQWTSRRIRASSGSTRPAGTCLRFRQPRRNAKSKGDLARQACQADSARQADSIVRRPLLFGQPGAVVGLGAAEPVHEGLEFRLQRLNFLVLPEYHVAQFSARAFQKSDLGLNLFQRLIVHPGSVAFTRRRRVSPRRWRRTSAGARRHHSIG
jgi:glutathione S-transferase